MAFELDPRLPPGRALKAVARAELRAAQAALARGTPTDVHEARKSSKKLRAWLRLLREPLGNNYALLDRLLRDAARSLAGQREGVVVLQTLRSLCRSPALPARVRDRLAAALAPTPTSPVRQRAARQRAQLLLETASLYFEQTALPPLDSAKLAAGFEAGLERAQRAYRQARKFPRADVLHDFRKRAKYHGYQSALLATRLPGTARPVQTLKDLSDALGRHHDLHVLAEHLDALDPAIAGTLALLPLREAIRGSSHRQAQRALRLGALLFDAPPDS